MNRRTTKIHFSTQTSDTRMSEAELESAEQMLAEFVARAIAAEHPEWFGKSENEAAEEE
ncbi:MAG TPA: hypothetical protein VGB30_00855 [bacterium]|jgi:hypothetical protein